MNLIRLFRIVNAKTGEIVLFILFFIFSATLAWTTFQYKDGVMHIASRVWSDFAATIPLIRSFSYGSNFPPEYPIFPGYPIRYHFLFYLVVGLLEKIGLPIDWALNLPSSLGFFLLLCTIYILSKKIFKKKVVGFLSVILFLFNGSFGFLEFFKLHPPSFYTFSDIINNIQFTSFGPYDGKIVSAFWSLNIFTNQRHLAFAYASFLFLFYIVYRYSQDHKGFSYLKAIMLGIFIGIFPFVHLAVFGMMGIALVVFFLLYPKLRLKLLTAGAVAIIIAIPQYLAMGRSQVETTLYNPLYLVNKPSITSFLNYWFLNFGLTSIIAPFGFVLANKLQRKIAIPFIALFIIGNIFQFTPEIAANHKFFNLVVIGLNMFTAYFLIYIWNKHAVGKIAALLLFIPLTFTGILDLFPIINDYRINLNDLPKNKTIAFIYRSTPNNSVFLNSSFLYNPASLAGRKIYLGWPYFSWSAGYDTDSRFKTMKLIFESYDATSACSLLTDENIDYILLEIPSGIENVAVNYGLFENNFNKIYQSTENSSIYEVASSCRNRY